MASGHRRHTRHIGIVINPAGSYWLSVVRGICDAMRQFPEWDTVIIKSEFLDPAILGTFPSSVDALIARVQSGKEIDLLCRQNRPVVNVSGLYPDAPFPMVTVDNEKVGTMAAQYLMGLGLRRLTFAGDLSGFSIQREKAFSAAVRNAGKHYIPPVECDVPHADFRNIPSLIDRKYDTPLGLFAVNDDAATGIVSLLQIHGVRIPQSVAVLGVDNEELAMYRCNVPLSSIELPTHGIGYQAAALTMRILGGETGLPQSILLQPGRVIARKSTDVMAVDDASVQKALSFIRANAHRPLTVADAAKSLGEVSLRTLQRRFLEKVGSTLQDCIHSARADRIKALLGEHEIPIKEVAYRSGFSSPDRFTKFFRMTEGMAPQEYRKGLPRRYFLNRDQQPAKPD